MKRYLILLFIFIVLFVTIQPVFAAPNKPQVSVAYVPVTAYQGETVEVEFSVASKGSNPGTWYAEFPKSTVSAVGVTEVRGLTLSEDGEKYVLTFNLKQLKIQTVAVNLTMLSSISGDYSLLSLYNQNLALVDQRQVEVLVPEISWSLESPQSLAVNTNFQIKLFATNNTAVAVDFDVDTEFFHQCTDRSVFPSAYPVLAVDGGGNSGSYWLRWAGSVPAGQVYEWVFDLKTSNYQCYYPVFELRDNQNNDLSIFKEWLMIGD